MDLFCNEMHGMDEEDSEIDDYDDGNQQEEYTIAMSKEDLMQYEKALANPYKTKKQLTHNHDWKHILTQFTAIC